MKMKERLEYNYRNFRRAEEICIECPVFFECGASASGDEKYWTVRQGEVPGRFATEKAHYERMLITGKPPANKCARGHDKPEGKRCPTCKRATNDRYYARVQALRARQEAARDV